MDKQEAIKQLKVVLGYFHNIRHQISEKQYYKGASSVFKAIDVLEELK